MNQLDYLNENALRRYPLKDGADVVFGAGWALPNSILLDLQINLRNTSGMTSPPVFYLNSINTLAQTITFSGSDTFIFNYSTNGLQTLFASSPHNDATLVINSDKLLDYFVYNRLSGLFTFSGQPEVCVSCLRLQIPMVNSITLSNTTGGSSFDIAYSDTYASGTSVNLLQGSNFDYSVTDNSVTVNILANAGAGLFDGCLATPNYIASVNNQSPDANGNIIVQTDGCVRVTPQSTGLMIGDVCSTPCTSNNVLDAAYYINRVSARKDELAALLSTGYQNYNDVLALYTTTETAKSAASAPYVLANCNTQSNSASVYSNITCGLYSANINNVAATPYISFATGTAPALFTLLDAQTYLNQNNTRTNIPLSLLNNNQLNLSSNSAAFIGLVLQQPGSAAPNHGNPAYDVTCGLTAGAFSSGYVLPVNPASANFSIAYSADSNTHTLSFSVAPSIGNATSFSSTTGAVNISIVYSSATGLTLLSSKMVTNDNCSNTNVGLNWSGTLNLASSSSYELSFVSSGTATATFIVSMSSVYGSASKTFAVNL